MAGSDIGAEEVVDASDSEGGEEYEVEKILDMKGKGKNVKYLVKWKGYDETENSWEPPSNLDGAKDELNRFLEERESVTPSKGNSKKANKGSSKTPTSSAASKRASKRHHKSESDADENEAEDGKKRRDSDDSDGEDGDEDYSSPSAGKKKKTEKKSSAKGGSSSRTPTSSSRHPAPHSVDSMTMAVNRRLNYGAHSSWLESDDSGSDTDNIGKKEKDKGKGKKENERDEQQPMGDAKKAEGGEGGKSNGSTPATLKMNGENGAAESPPLDLENEGTKNDDENSDGKKSNEPSEHDPPALSIDVGFPKMNTFNGIGGRTRKNSAGRPNSSHSFRASNERSVSQAKDELATKKLKGKEASLNLNYNHSNGANKGSAGDFEFEGVYSMPGGAHRYIAKRTTDNTTHVLSYEEAKAEHHQALCDFLNDRIKFDANGDFNVVVASHSSNSNAMATGTAVVEKQRSLLRDDGKLAFEE